MAKIIGKAGNDVISGTSSADEINGAGGNDVIHGNGGNDSIQGGDGNDMLFGDAGNDALQGGNGNDYLDGGTDVDSLNGGDGNDILVWDINDSVRAGGSGFDTLKVLGSGQTVDLTVLHKDQFRSIEQVDLNGSGPNTLKVSANSIHEGDHDVNALTGTPDTLIVRLGLDDIVNKGTGWTEQTPEVLAGVLYRVYTHPNSALSTSTLLIENHGPIAFDDGPISFFDTGVHETGNTNLLSNDFGVGTLSVSSLSSLSTAGTNNNLFTISQSGLEIDINLTPAINALIPTDALYFFGLKDNTASINVSSLGVVSVSDGGGLLEFLPLSKTIKVAFDYTLNDGLGGTDTGNASVTINGVDNRDLLVAGFAGGETLSGGDNGDLLISQAGVDVLHGNGGDDYLVSGGGADQLYGDAGNDIIRGGGASQGTTANYSADVLDSDGRAFINAAPPTPTQMDVVAQAITGGTLFNYSFSLQTDPALFGGLTSGIVAQGVNAGAVDGTDLIVADLLTIVNQVLNPTPNSTSTVDLINFAGHTYQLYNGIQTTAGNEWVSALIPVAGQEGALIVGGDFTSAAGGSYYVLQGSSGNDIMIGGNSSSTAPSYGYFLIGEGGNNILIGGDNTGSMDYYVAATDNTNGGFAVPFPQTVGNSILIGGDNMGTGTYYMFGAQGNDVLMAGSNALGNTYDLYYFSGGGGTNLFVSNTGKHVFDGSSGSNGATIHDGFVNHIQDTNDTVQYHQDVLGGVNPGDVRTFLTAGSPTYVQMNAVSQALVSSNLLNYNFSLAAAGADSFASLGGILVAALNAAALFDGHDLLVGNTVTGGSITSPLSSIPNIDFNAASDLSGTNFGFSLFNGPASSSSPVTVTAGGSDAIVIGGNNVGSSYTLMGGAGNDLLIGGTNDTTYTIDGGAGNNIVIGGANTGGTYTLQAEGGNDILIAGSNSGGTYVLQDSTSESALFFAGANTGGLNVFTNSGTGIDMLSYIAISAGVTIDLGQTGVLQNTGGDGMNELFGTFSILQGSNFDDNLSFTESNTGTSGGSLGGVASSDISSESIYGMAGNDVILISGTAIGGSGDVGNEASSGNSINAQVITNFDLLDAGLGTAAQSVSMVDTADGASALATFGNEALSGNTAISGNVTIEQNTLTTENALASDNLLIQATATGGDAGSTAWDSVGVNTGGNVADGVGSEAISAQAVIDHNTFNDSIGGATMTIEGHSIGGSSNVGLYANEALDDATAISAQTIISTNIMDGDSSAAGFAIIATATCGNGAFSANVSGFDNSPTLTIPGGTAIGGEVIVDHNTLTDTGSADSTLSIQATASGGTGHFFGNFAYQGTAISAEVNIENNTLTAGSGNDTLSIDATANGSIGPNGADGPGALAINTEFNILGNILQGGAGDDILQLLIHDNPGGINIAFNGASSNAAISEQLTLMGNELLGAGGNDLFIINSPAFLEIYNNPGETDNLINGGTTGFNTLEIQPSSAFGDIDLTALTVDSGGTAANSSLAVPILENIERIDITNAGVTNLTMNATEVNALNPDQTLVVKGDASETVNLNDPAGTWNLVGSGVAAPAIDTDPADSVLTFNHYQATVALHIVDLFVQSAVTVVAH